MNESAYNRTSQVFHWLSALFIIGLLVMGTIMVRVDDGSALKATMYRGHITFGMLIVIITIARLVWLLRSGMPEKLKMPKWEEQAFTWNHRLLYLFIFLLGFSGVGMLLQSGMSLLPTAVDPAAIQDVTARNGHNLFSKLLLVLFLMHVGGVFYYQFNKGDTLVRMGVNWLKGKA